MLTKIFKSFYTPWNLLILIILLFAFILRIYRIESLLDFHYDQGRDAKIIWDLWHSQKLFLIGPTTGLEGIFLGPFYYYLIAPFYLIGGGNPTIPSMFLSLLYTIALYILYLTGFKIQGRFTGFVALVVGAFSNNLVFSSRWLSNPTPIFLTSIIIFYLMVLIIKKEKPIYWILVYLAVGVSLQLELASAVFYLPILAIFTIWQLRKINIKIFLLACVIFFVTLIPQILFNFKHQNILLNNIINEVKNGKSVQINYVDRIGNLWKITKEIF